MAAPLVNVYSQMSRLLSRKVVVPNVACAGYAVKKPSKVKGKAGAAIPQQNKHYDDVETDPVKLTTMLCGGNILKEGSDPVLGEDSAYPAWLWDLRLDRSPVPLEDLDVNTREYWKRVNKMNIKRTRQLQKARSTWKIF